LYSFFTDANEELAVMKANAARNVPAPVESDHERKPPTAGAYEAMPALRARLGKTGRSPSTVRSAGAGAGAGTFPPHQNPVQMVQEMVGRVKVRDSEDYLLTLSEAACL
jgi:hypothetical protein